MNIPIEIIVVAVIAILVLAVVIAIIIKKRNQEVDDDYQWSAENREKRAKKKKKRQADQEEVFLETKPKADTNPAKDTSPKADILIDPKDIENNPLMQEVYDIINKEQHPEDNEEDYYERETFGTGKHSRLIGNISSILVVLVNLLLWIFLKPTVIDQSIIAVIDDYSPICIIEAIIVTLVEAIMLRSAVINLYEMVTGVATKEEFEKEGKTKRKIIIRPSLILLVSTVLLLISIYSYDEITEEGFKSHSPLSPYMTNFKWEEASSIYTYKENFFSKPTTRIDVDSKHNYVKIKLHHFDYLTEAAKEKYGEDGSQAMLDYVFLEK